MSYVYLITPIYYLLNISVTTVTKLVTIWESKVYGVTVVVKIPVTTCNNCNNK